MIGAMRILAVLFACGFSLWFGYQAHSFLQENRCLEHGGKIGSSGLCEGAKL
ncbi:MAG: hypothetical protein GY952_04960 [Rhodobacteraceae bacterium]|nr:hypothetical protein [Paracoccaceae bacterium]